MKPNELTGAIIGAAIEVHRELGPGKPEAAYEAALALELAARGFVCIVQKPVPVVYKGVKLECGYRLDLLVAGKVVVEIKSVEIVIPVHRAQVLTYMKLGGWQLALLLNFNVATLKEGIERLVLGFEEEAGVSAATRKAQSFSRSSGDVAPPRRPIMQTGKAPIERFASAIIDAAAEVHRELGPGLLPSAYEMCLCHELCLRNVAFERKRRLALHYKGSRLAESDDVELLVGGCVAVKLGASLVIQPVHEAELLSQLRLGDWQLGLLINFNTIRFGEGLRRIVLDLRETSGAKRSNP